MNDFAKEFVSICAKHLPRPVDVLEVGSQQVHGQEGYADLRPLFPNSIYIGIDKYPGTGVDNVFNIVTCPFTTKSDLIISVGTIEHVFDVFKFADNIKASLTSDGIALITAVFDFQIHEYPGDYWRMTPATMSLLFPNSFCFYDGPDNRPVNIGCVYFKHPEIWYMRPMFEELNKRLSSRRMPFGEACNRTIYLWKQFLGLK